MSTDTNNGAAAEATQPPAAATGAPTGYEDPEVLHKLADVLRTTMKIRNGVLQETRVDYFKGARWMGKGSFVGGRNGWVRVVFTWLLVGFE